MDLAIACVELCFIAVIVGAAWIALLISLTFCPLFFDQLMVVFFFVSLFAFAFVIGDDLPPRLSSQAEDDESANFHDE